MAKWNEGIRIEEALGTQSLLYPARRLFKKWGRTPVDRGQTPV